MHTKPFLLHALSPLHAGTGQAVDVIDLPIARMTATGMPYVPGSSIKGVLRDAMRLRNPEADDARERVQDTQLVKAIFGPEAEDGASDHAGALMVGDARLLALPVRSYFGTFAWVTSPLLLTLAQRDFQDGGVSGVPQAIPQLGQFQAAPTSASAGVVHKNKVFLVDLDISVNANEVHASMAWAKFLAPLIYQDNGDVFIKRFLVVDDETMTFLWETATQVDTRIRMDSITRTVADGALWVEESLPAETLLVGLLVAERIRRDRQHNDGKEWPSPQQVIEQVVAKANPALQFGGKATVGRGRCRMIGF